MNKHFIMCIVSITLYFCPAISMECDLHNPGLPSDGRLLYAFPVPQFLFSIPKEPNILLLTSALPEQERITPYCFNLTDEERQSIKLFPTEDEGSPQISYGEKQTVIMTNKHIYRYSANDLPKKKIIRVDGFFSEFKATIATPKFNDSYYVIHQIARDNDNQIVNHCINTIYPGNPHQIIKIFSRNYSTTDANVSYNPLITCHPHEKEIAFKLVNNRIAIIPIISSSYDSTNDYDYSVALGECSDDNQSYKILKYSPSGKFIVALYDTKIALINYAQLLAKKPCTEFGHHQDTLYSSMIFYLDTDILCLLDNQGNIFYFDPHLKECIAKNTYLIEHTSACPTYILDNLLFVTCCGKKIYAMLGSNLIAYNVPQAVLKYREAKQ